jgi:hypothetical protein
MYITEARIKTGYDRRVVPGWPSLSFLFTTTLRKLISHTDMTDVDREF